MNMTADSTGLKVPPNNLQLESYLIGKTMLNEDLIHKVDHLSSDAFYDRRHGMIWESILAIHADGLHPNAALVNDRMGQLGTLKAIGGFEKLVTICETTPHVGDFEEFADILNQYWVLRRLIQVGEKISALGYDTERSFEEVVAEAECLFLDVTQQGRKSPAMINFADLALPTMEKIETAKDAGGKAPGLTSGLYDIDDLTGGFQKQQSIYILAQQKTGKTAFGLQIARHMSITHDAVGIYFSLEMPAEQLFLRQVAAVSGINTMRLKSGSLSDQEINELPEKIQKSNMLQARIWLDDRPGLTIEEIASRSRRCLIETGKVDFIIIDHLHLVETQNKRLDANQKVGVIAKTVLGLSKEMNIPILVLCQSSRVYRDRKDPRPLPSDVLGSSSVEQCANLMIGLYRDEMHFPDTTDRGIAEAHILLNRDGPTGVARLLYRAETTTFLNMKGRRVI